MSDLIARLEAATEGSRELDAEIAECLRAAGCIDPLGLYMPRRYTTSLDAALTLVPEGAEWLRKSPQVMTVYWTPTGDKEWAVHHDGSGETSPLSLCIAALKAREAVNE